MSQPDISFIVAAYNAGLFIEDAIRSALVQNGVTLEVIVVDDGSKDETENIVRRMMKVDERIRFLKQSNQGVSSARNHGIELATGKWIAILDADDYIDCNRSYRLIDTARRLNSEIIFDNLLRFYHDNQKKIPSFISIKSDRTISIGLSDYLEGNLMLRGDNNIGYLKPIVQSNFIKSNSIRYKDDLRTGEDFDFCLQCLVKGANMCISFDKSYFYRVSSQSLSRRLEISDLDKLISYHDKVFGNTKQFTENINISARRYRRSLKVARSFVSFRINAKKSPIFTMFQGIDMYLWEGLYRVILTKIKRKLQQLRLNRLVE